MFKEIVSMAAYNISHKKLRSFLTVLGIIIGVATIVAILALGAGAEQSIFKQLNKIGGDNVLIMPGNVKAQGVQGLQHISSGVSGKVAKLTDTDINVISSVEGVERVYATVSTNGEISSNNENVSLTINGIKNPEAWASVEGTNIGLESGRFISSSDKYAVVIGNSVAHDIFSKEINIRKTIKINEVEFRIVGVLNKAGGVLSMLDQRVYITEPAFREVFPNALDPDQFSLITAKVKKGYDADDVSLTIEEKLLKLHKETKDTMTFSVISPAFFQDTIKSVMGVFVGFLGSIAFISLLVGAIGIANIMYVSVTERTREIGVMKALGAKKRVILLMFLIESGIIGLIGGAIGVGAGYGLSQAMSYGLAQSSSTGAGPPFTIEIGLTPDLILLGIAFGFIVGILAGYFPARKAANLQPVDALRYE